MNENFVTNFKLSQKLKNAGVKQASEFYWNIKEKKLYHKDNIFLGMVRFDEFYTSAFLHPELDALLPPTMKKVLKLNICRDDKGNCVVRYSSEAGTLSPVNKWINVKSKNSCDALGLMILRLGKRLRELGKDDG